MKNMAKYVVPMMLLMCMLAGVVVDGAITASFAPPSSHAHGHTYSWNPVGDLFNWLADGAFWVMEQGPSRLFAGSCHTQMCNH